LLPLGGISNAATILCNESGQYVIYRSDEHGFRNPAGVWKAPAADLAAVGQSPTQGYCVPDGSGFMDVLRADYPVTLNLGISGQSSLLQLAAIKEYIAPYSPRVVLWCFYEGQDLQGLYEEATHPLIMRYLQPTFSQHLIRRQHEIDESLRRLVSEQESRLRRVERQEPNLPLVHRSLGLVKLWHVRETFESAYARSDDERAWLELERLGPNLLKDALVQANILTRRWGGMLYVVYLPSWTRYKNGAALVDRDRARVLSLVNSLGIPAIDVSRAFAAQPDPLALFPFRRFGHYNEAGNRIVAQTILEFLSAHPRPRS